MKTFLLTIAVLIAISSARADTSTPNPSIQLTPSIGQDAPDGSLALALSLKNEPSPHWVLTEDGGSNPDATFCSHGSCEKITLDPVAPGESLRLPFALTWVKENGGWSWKGTSVIKNLNYETPVPTIPLTTEPKEPSEVPEPGTFYLFATGIVLFTVAVIFKRYQASVGL